MAYCTRCGTRIADDARFCAQCGASTSMHQHTTAYVPPRNSMLNAGAILLYVAGGMGILSAIGLIIIGSIFMSNPDYAFSIIGAVYLAFGIILLPLCAVAIFGGYKAKNRSSFKWAIAGCICGIITFSVAGILACVFIGMSKHEFPNNTP